METELHLVSTHPIVVRFLRQVLYRDSAFRRRLRPEAVSDTRCTPQKRGQHLFLLDLPALPLELSVLCRDLRTRCPRGRLLALVPSHQNTDEEILRLLYAGIDGVVGVGEGFEAELPRAVRALMAGSFWVPRHVVWEYVKQTNLLMDAQVSPDHPLTARESQVFHLMVRRLSNKEIGQILGVAERTVKFHVANIFAKTKVQNRRSLLSNVPRLLGSSLEGLSHRIRGKPPAATLADRATRFDKLLMSST